LRGRGCRGAGVTARPFPGRAPLQAPVVVLVDLALVAGEVAQLAVHDHLRALAADLGDGAAAGAGGGGGEPSRRISRAGPAVG